MTTVPRPPWILENQRHLMREVEVVRRALDRSPEPPPPEVEPHPDGPYALEMLAEGFGLSTFERAIVVLAAGVELDAAFAAACSEAQGEPRRSPSFGLALAILSDAHWSALGPAGPLRRWKLIELSGGDLLTRSALRIDERVLHYLTGVPSVDERLMGLIEAVPPTADLPLSQRDLVEQLVPLWRTPGWPLVQLVGDPGASKRAIAATLAEVTSLKLYAVRAGDLPSSPSEREVFARLWGREAVLGQAALFVDADDLETQDRARLGVLVDRLPGAVVLAVRDPLHAVRRPGVRMDVSRPTREEQVLLWHRHLGELADGLNGRLDALVDHFSMGDEAIRGACLLASGAPDGSTVEALWDACRAQARPRLDDLAQRIRSESGWDDLVLPDAPKQLLREIASQVRQRGRVYEDWGFGKGGGRGLGISVLFAGASGTGKTMAAEVLARELRLDLYRIDLSQVVSKYIGETEKNLRRVFDAAEGGGAVLLFDEADALFGKRSEVKDSHDRYANIEVSYLLQRMEAYRGLAILTTNLRNSLDPAFVRRLRFIVSFPYPDPAQREEIWRRVFPSGTPSDQLHPGRLARLNVAGGNIRNIALHAAFLAADAGEPVRMRHLLRAARAECAKLERTITDSEIEGWV